MSHFCHLCLKTDLKEPHHPYPPLCIASSEEGWSSVNFPDTLLFIIFTNKDAKFENAHRQLLPSISYIQR